MANVFRKYTATATTGGVTVYTVPAATVAVVIGLTLSNTSANSINSTATIGGVSLVTDVPVPAGSTLSALDGKIVMEATDTLDVSATENSSLDVIISVLEQT